MLNLGIDNAFTHLFRERRWWLKLGIIAFLSFVVSVLSSLYERLSQNVIPATKITAKSLTAVESVSGLVVVVCLIIFFVVYTLFTVWYEYENIQAAIQKRDSKLIWEYSFIDTIKKTFKYIIANFVYSIFTFIITAVVIGIPVFAFIILLSVALGGTSVSYASNNSIAGLVVILGCCVVGVLVLAIVAVVYALTSAGYLRMIATNTFSEAFNFSASYKIAKKYFWYFMLVFVIFIVMLFVFGMASGFVGIFISAMNLLNPVVGLVLEVLMQIPLSILGAYITIFIYSRLIGNLYRAIIEKEDDLKFLR